MGISDLFIIISQLFDRVTITEIEKKEIVKVEGGRVSVERKDSKYLTVNWKSSFENDAVGDCLAFMLNSVGEMGEELLQPFVEHSRGHNCKDECELDK